MRRIWGQRSWDRLTKLLKGETHTTPSVGVNAMADEWKLLLFYTLLPVVLFSSLISQSNGTNLTPSLQISIIEDSNSGYFNLA